MHTKSLECSGTFINDERITGAVCQAHQHNLTKTPNDNCTEDWTREHWILLKWAIIPRILVVIHMIPWFLTTTINTAACQSISWKRKFPIFPVCLILFTAESDYSQCFPTSSTVVVFVITIWLYSQYTKNITGPMTGWTLELPPWSLSFTRNDLQHYALCNPFVNCHVPLIRRAVPSVFLCLKETRIACHHLQSGSHFNNQKFTIIHSASCSLALRRSMGN